MSDRDPNINGDSYTPSINSNKRLNPTAFSYAPESRPQNNMPRQVSAPPSLHLEARVIDLEEEYASLRGDVDTLTKLYDDLCSSVDNLKKRGWPVTVGPFQEQDLYQSHRRAMEFKQELEELGREVHKSVDGVADVEKVNNTTIPKANTSMPPHMRVANGINNRGGLKSLPPHLRGKSLSG